MVCAIKCASRGIRATLVSPYPSERAQSVMAAGGINAVLASNGEDDTVDSHIEDTIKGGCFLGGKNAVKGLCSRAEEIIRYLEGIGTVFSVDKTGHPAKRAFGGQSHKRTYYCGASTGKQIVSALVMEARRYEAEGLISRRIGSFFHSALIRDGVCYGALLFDERAGELVSVYADALVMAVGGQNALFGKTTGSTLCDGYAAGKLFTQGVTLKNLEFIQYHPTAIETGQKRMLVSEAVRGEGGRLFYEEQGERVYFMEDKYGPGGNLMTRDVISREIDACRRDVYLDISFLDGKLIDERLPEVRDICRKYRNIDIKKEPIPVSPSVHFFMGGLAVRLNHETNIGNLFAVGECASMYHGANRLGGNSLLAAVYGGIVAAEEIADRESASEAPDFGSYLRDEQEKLIRQAESKSNFPVMMLRDDLAKIMRERLGIVRNEESLKKGVADIELDLYAAERLKFDPSVSAYANYSLSAILTAARATLTCALERRESRGAHFRSDFPKSDDGYLYPTLISWDGGAYRVSYDREGIYEN
nr:FAD-binding protein [Clostridiales bacterium]